LFKEKKRVVGIFFFFFPTKEKESIT